MPGKNILTNYKTEKENYMEAETDIFYKNSFVFLDCQAFYINLHGFSCRDL